MSIEIPREVFAILRRTRKTFDPTVIVATVDADGSPRTAPFGSLCAISPRLLRFACDRRHDTYANIARDGRISINLLAPLTLAVSIRGRATVKKERMAVAPEDALIEIEVDEVKDDWPPIPGLVIECGIMITATDKLNEYVQNYLSEVQES